MNSLTASEARAPGATAQSRTMRPSKRFFEAGSALRRVLQEAPYLARCSDDKTAARVRPREYAISYPYIQINRPGMVSWLVFDLDHPNALIWDDVALPTPNLIVRNRTSGHAHLYYAIATVCTSENARSAPISYMKAIYQAYAALLKADPEYASGPVAKTPGHPWWDTSEYHNHVYDLGELAECVELVKGASWSKGPQLDKAQHSRHCILFEQLRYFAYSIVNEEREAGTFTQFVRRLDAFAYNHNDYKAYGFTESLPVSSLKATVKSVARWTWDRYRGTGRCHRGAMTLPAGMALDEKQRLSALRTHRVRHQATESKIRAACRRLQNAGEKMTITAIAHLTGLTRQTVAVYRHVLQEVQRLAISVAQLPSALASKNVNYGAHQVTAAVCQPFGSSENSAGMTTGSEMATTGKREKRAQRSRAKAKQARVLRNSSPPGTADIDEIAAHAKERLDLMESAEIVGGRVGMLAALIEDVGLSIGVDEVGMQRVFLAVYDTWKNGDPGKLSAEWWAEPDFLRDYAEAAALTGRQDLVGAWNEQLDCL